jgi:hypothetical protein
VRGENVSAFEIPAKRRRLVAWWVAAIGVEQLGGDDLNRGRPARRLH